VQAERALDRPQADVRGAEQERRPGERDRQRLEEALADRPCGLAAADNEERPEHARLERRRRRRVPELDVQARREVVRVARIQHPNAPPEWLGVPGVIAGISHMFHICPETPGTPE